MRDTRRYLSGTSAWIPGTPVADHSSSSQRATGVKAFSFHIDTSAKFDRSGRRIRKSRLDLALQFRLPSLKFETAAKAVPDRPARQKPSRFVSSPSEILAVHQSRYDDFMISTMQQRDGSWIAGFGCADGRPLLSTGWGAPAPSGSTPRSGCSPCGSAGSLSPRPRTSASRTSRPSSRSGWNAAAQASRGRGEANLSGCE